MYSLQDVLSGLTPERHLYNVEDAHMTSLLLDIVPTRSFLAGNYGVGIRVIRIINGGIIIRCST